MYQKAEDILVTNRLRLFIVNNIPNIWVLIPRHHKAAYMLVDTQQLDLNDQENSLYIPKDNRATTGKLCAFFSSI